jgi:hypothetical protein
VYKPTQEQLAAIEHFQLGKPFKITAFAGTGKTSTLQLLAADRKEQGLYLAFNRSIASEAKLKFPKTVDCRTTHSIAWRTVQPSHRFSTGKMSTGLHSNQLAETLELKDRVFGKRLKLSAVHQAHFLLRTIRGFCQSASQDISPEHVPHYGRLMGMPEDVIADAHAWAVSGSTELWRRMINHRDRLPLGHDGYLKLWALGQPKLSFDFILLDEAQDTNPVVLDVLSRQSAQVVYVGDKHQQIYEWRGAVNAMEKIAGLDEAYLSQSFRFGSVIAEAASKVLGRLGERVPIRGNPAVSSVIAPSGTTDAVLARTNATVMGEILNAIAAGLAPHVIGGTDELKRMLSDVFELKENKPGTSPEFFGFQNWTEVIDFSGTEEGEDLKTFVQLVEQHGERRIWKAISSASANEQQADVILSTAHKAKGREWDSVRLAPDFLSSKAKEGGPTADAEVRLFYVAMTRAKQLLVVDPAMLEGFKSGAWKNAPDVDQRASRPTARDDCKSGPPIREIISVQAREAHPSAIPSMPATAKSPPRQHSSNGHAPTHSPRPKPPPAVTPQMRTSDARPTLLRVQPKSNDDQRAPTQFGASRRPMPPARPSSTEREGGFWRRVARLFGKP